MMIILLIITEMNLTIISRRDLVYLVGRLPSFLGRGPASVVRTGAITIPLHLSLPTPSPPPPSSSHNSLLVSVNSVCHGFLWALCWHHHNQLVIRSRRVPTTTPPQNGTLSLQRWKCQFIFRLFLIYNKLTRWMIIGCSKLLLSFLSYFM